MLCALIMILIVGIVAIFVLVHFIDRCVPINQSTKTCLITGASSGIGSELAIQMVKRGWRVIGIARRTYLLEELQKQLGNNFVFFTCDVSNHDQIVSTSNEIKAKGLQPTLFFLNAGIREQEKHTEVVMEDFQKIFATNYFGVIAWIEQWLPMVKNYGGGTFVATSSIAAIFDPVSASYSASKVALINSFQTLRITHLNDKIGFSVVVPGIVDTAMESEAAHHLPFVQTPEYAAQKIIKQIFKKKKRIELSWVYSTGMRLMKLLPDQIVVRIRTWLIKIRV